MVVQTLSAGKERERDGEIMRWEDKEESKKKIIREIYREKGLKIKIGEREKEIQV